MPHSNDAPLAPDEDSSHASRARQGALIWIRQALSDIEQAMESENTEVAQALLYRIQDVLDMLARQRLPGETRRISEIRALVDNARNRRS